MTSFLKRGSRHKARGILIVAVGCLAIGLIGYGLWGLWNRHQAVHDPTVTIPAETVTHSTGMPNETPPEHACSNYHVADSQPRKIEVPSVDISGCIQKVGVDQNNAIAVPTNIHLAGWYVGSALPGEKGVSIIDGHVLGRYQDAIFKALKDIKPGDIIRIQFGDHSWKEFETIDTNSYPVKESKDPLFAQHPTADRQLTLITCSGAFDAKTQSYDRRTIVRAVYKAEN